jgi:hypothetical protein
MLRKSLLALALAALWACQTPIRGHHEFDASAPFPTYATFAWITDGPLIGPTGATPVSPMLDPAVRRSVERVLEAKGYERVARPEEADLVLSFSLGTRERLVVDSYPVHAGYRYGYGTWVSDVRTYTEGILAIDVFDRRTKAAVWHGWASKDVVEGTAPEERDRYIDAGVDVILAQFPARGAPPR